MAIRSVPGGAILHNEGTIIDGEECCGEACVCCDANELPEELFLSMDQFTIQPSPYGPFAECDPFYMCNDGDFSITNAPGAPTGQPGSELAFSTGDPGDANPGPNNGPSINVAAIKLRCAIYADGVARWYVYAVGGVPILTGRYSDRDLGAFPQFGVRNCIFFPGFTGSTFLGVPSIVPILYNIIGPAQSCSPFFLQGVAPLDFWVTPTAAIFVDRCERQSTMRFTVTE